MASIFKNPAQKETSAPAAAQADTAVTGAEWLFQMDTGADNSNSADIKAEKQEPAQREKKREKEEVKVKTEKGPESKRKRKADESVETEVVVAELQPAKRTKLTETEAVFKAPSPVKKTKPAASANASAATDSKEPTLKQLFMKKAASVLKFNKLVLLQVKKKILQMKAKPKAGNKFGLDRLDVAITNFIKEWDGIKTYKDCKPRAAKGHMEHLRDVIKNNPKLLKEVVEMEAEATVNRMTLMYVLLSEDGQQIMQEIFDHMDTLPEEEETSTTTGIEPLIIKKEPGEPAAPADGAC